MNNLGVTVNTVQFFRHRVHVRVVLIGLLQTLVLIGAIYAAVFIRFAARMEALQEPGALLSIQALLYAAVIQICMVALGVYKPQRQGGHLGVVVRIVASFVLAGVGLSVIFYVLPALYFGRGIAVIAAAVSLAVILIIQLWEYRLSERQEAGWRVLFYGAGDNAASILSRLRRRSDYRFFTLRGCVPAPGEAVRVDSGLVRHAGGPLLAYARLHRINEIVVVMDDRRRGFPSQELLDCRLAGIQVSDALSFYESQTGKVKTELLSPHWLIYSDGFGQTGIQNAAKRCLDLLFALILFVLFSPFMLLTIITTKFEDGWRAPVFFTQTRVGLDGREFRLFKFRSMRVDAEAEAKAQWAREDDPRITRAGVYIRKYRMDELPQLFNVIKGDMSLVGPRPERPEFVNGLAEKLPYYSVRHQVRPGITGWAQLSYPYGASDEDANAKLQFDLYYVKNRSTFLDFLILLGTVEVVLTRKGSR
jgi:sugar transferase (PEP-CTERM system associated)